MKNRIFVYFIGLVLIPALSCSHSKNKNDLMGEKNRVLQEGDGSISLKLEDAACYSDALNPSHNTAEWKMVISRPGRFKVWLSSATRDTMDLHYANSVKISLLDNELEINPACDKIFPNSGEYPSSYFRADSYMGSFFVSEPGEYHIQVISEKVTAKNTSVQNNSRVEDTMLKSVILTPLVR